MAQFHLTLHHKSASGLLVQAPVASATSVNLG